MAQLNHEPSMEDILASIKRIIAEDSEAVAPRAARPIRREIASVPAEPVEVEPATIEAEHEAPVIEAAPEVEAVAEVAPVAEIEAPLELDNEVGAAETEETETADVLELTSPLAEDVPASPEPEIEQPQPQPVVQAKPLRSKPARAETVQPDPIQPPRESVMDRLMSDPAAQASRNAFAALSQLQVRAEAGQENTLEGVVSDLLRPMLREWLDRELPGLVERMVAEEIGRVSGRA